MEPFGHQDPTHFLFFQGRDFIDVYCKLTYKGRFFTHVLTDSIKQENPIEGKPIFSETTRRIKEIVNVSRAEIVNRATKYLRDSTKHLRQTLDGHILIVLQITPVNSFQPSAKFTKNSISDVSGILDFLFDLM